MKVYKSSLHLETRSLLVTLLSAAEGGVGSRWVCRTSEERGHDGHSAQALTGQRGTGGREEGTARGNLRTSQGTRTLRTGEGGGRAGGGRVRGEAGVERRR